MFRWCSYCQQFSGEVAPYDDFLITHGICTACARKVRGITSAELAQARILKDIQDQLYDAGWRGDLKEAADIIENAAGAHVRGVDILLGFISPMLYQIGKDCKQGAITSAEAIRFATFCGGVFELIAAKLEIPAPNNATNSGRIPVLLVNAPGNTHTLGVRVLALWLLSDGIDARVVDVPSDLEEWVTVVASTRSKVLLISMALAEQRKNVAAVVELLAKLPKSERPKIIVGGYAVKLGLVTEIPGADLIADIRLLREAVRE